MTEPLELPVSFLDPAMQRLERLELALNHVGKAIELELADVAIDPSLLTDETKVKLQAIGNSLLNIAGVGISVASDVGEVVELDSDVAALGSSPDQIPPSPTHSRRSPRTTSSSGNGATAPRRPGARRTPAAASTTNHTNSPGTQPVRAPDAKEKTEAAPSPLYEKLVIPSETPGMQRAEGTKAVNISIVADNCIRIGDRELVIGGHQRFLFNALMLLRDKPRAADEIRELGFYPESTNGSANVAFSTSMKDLSSLINTAAGVELIKKVGAGPGTRYCVNPNLTLLEERP